MYQLPLFHMHAPVRNHNTNTACSRISYGDFPLTYGCAVAKLFIGQSQLQSVSHWYEGQIGFTKYDGLMGVLPCYVPVDWQSSSKHKGQHTVSIQYSQFNNQIHNYDEFALVVNPIIHFITRLCIIHLGPRSSVASNNVRIEGGYGC